VCFVAGVDAHRLVLAGLASPLELGDLLPSQLSSRIPGRFRSKLPGVPAFSRVALWHRGMFALALMAAPRVCDCPSSCAAAFRPSAHPLVVAPHARAQPRVRLALVWAPLWQRLDFVLALSWWRLGHALTLAAPFGATRLALVRHRLASPVAPLHPASS
jgi:hypothetical protein